MTSKFKIRADVLHYFVVVAVGAGGTYAFTQFYGDSDEVKESKLRARYPQQIKNNEQQHAQMQEFFNQMKNSDQALDSKMSEILKAGKGDKKRHNDLKRLDTKPVVSATPTSNATTSLKSDIQKDTGEPNTPSISNGWWNGWGWW